MARTNEGTPDPKAIATPVTQDYSWIEDLLEELVYGFLPKSERAYLEKVPSKQFKQMLEAKQSLIVGFEKALVEELTLIENFPRVPVEIMTHIQQRKVSLTAKEQS